MFDPIDFILNASGLYVPPLIGLAVNPLGRFQPCGTGNCCEGGCCLRVAFSTVASCLGGTYNLAQIDATTWQCSAYNACFSSNPQLLKVVVTESEGTYYVTVTVDGHTWEKSYVSAPDVCAFSSESISHDSSGGCNSSTATCTLTANLDTCPSCGVADCSTDHCPSVAWENGVTVTIPDTGEDPYLNPFFTEDPWDCLGVDAGDIFGTYILSGPIGLAEPGICNLEPLAPCFFSEVFPPFVTCVDPPNASVSAICVFKFLTFWCVRLRQKGVIAGLWTTTHYHSDPVTSPSCEDCFSGGPMTLTFTGLAFTKIIAHYLSAPATDALWPNTVTLDAIP